LADGSYEEGVTNEFGETHLISTADIETVAIEVVEE
jgi:hypothetical protein